MKFIRDERNCKELINWGKTIPELKKNYLKADERLVEETKEVLNNFKNQVNNLYTIHKTKFNNILSSKEEVEQSMPYDSLCTLIDADYIKYAL